MEGIAVNIKDIARICGVGVSTVSRVLNNHPDVKKETREKILEAMKTYNYIPNNSARILKSSNNHQIGVLVKGVFNPFFSEMLQIIEERVHEYGYSVILQHYDHKDVNDMSVLVSFIKEKRLPGVICLGGNFEGIKPEHFENLDVSIVLTSVDKSVGGASDIISTVSIDNEYAAYEATKYLVQREHKHIALMLGDEYDAGVGNKRALGYMRALDEARLPIAKDLIRVGGYNYEEAYKAAKSLFEERPEVTGLFAISDVMAIGACKAALDSGRRVPEDVSIMGFDGMDIGRYYNPAITTIQQPQKQMATESIKLLFDCINGKSQTKHIILPTTLVERQSCAQ